MNRYQRQFKKQVDERDLLWTKIMSISQDRLIHRINPSEWSSQEILHHLYLAETGVLTVLKKQLQKERSTFQNEKLNNKMRSFLLNISLISNFKFKAPAVTSNLENVKSIEDLHTSWQTFKNEMMELLGESTSDIANKLVFRHPVAGWLTLNATLQFMRYHQSHHAKQIVHRAGIL